MTVVETEMLSPLRSSYDKEDLHEGSYIRDVPYMQASPAWMLLSIGNIPLCGHVSDASGGSESGKCSYVQACPLRVNALVSPTCGCSQSTVVLLFCLFSCGDVDKRQCLTLMKMRVKGVGDSVPSEEWMIKVHRS